MASKRLRYVLQYPWVLGPVFPPPHKTCVEIKFTNHLGKHCLLNNHLKNFKETSPLISPPLHSSAAYFCWPMLSLPAFPETRDQVLASGGSHRWHIRRPALSVLLSAYEWLQVLLSWCHAGKRTREELRPVNSCLAYVTNWVKQTNKQTKKKKKKRDWRKSQTRTHWSSCDNLCRCT